MQYHYLISGHPNITLEKQPQTFDFTAWMREILETVTPKDQNLVRLLFLSYDYTNIGNLLKGNEDNFNTKGNFTLSQLKENLFGSIDDVPDYMKDIAAQFQIELGNLDSSHSFPRFVLQHFYQAVEDKCSNKFLRNWFAFDKILRNVQSAWMSKKMGVDVRNELIGIDDDIEMFTKSALPDYGLRKKIHLGEEIFNLLEENIDILEREFRFDMIRWKIADELTTFNYFDIDVVLAFVAKADILDRWLKLNTLSGKEKFDNLVKEMRCQVSQ